MSNVDKVLIVWNNPEDPPVQLEWPKIHVPLQVGISLKDTPLYCAKYIF